MGKEKYLQQMKTRGAILALHRLEDTYKVEPSSIRMGTLSKKHIEN